jgi:predicted ATPase
MIIDRIRVPEALVADPAAWPFTVPAVAALVGEGLVLDAPVTFLVGENGSGKSTVVEAVAEAWGADVRGGRSHGRYASELEPSELGGVVELGRTPTGGRMTGRRAKGYFLRSETALDMFTRHEGHDPGFHGVSHGESFLHAFDARLAEKGLYLLDEPEAALSFTACLQLMGTLADVVDAGGQVICATHSPVLTALPGAAVLQFGERGVERATWAELDLVQHWRAFLDEPGRYLRHL